MEFSFQEKKKMQGKKYKAMNMCEEGQLTDLELKLEFTSSD